MKLKLLNFLLFLAILISITVQDQIFIDFKSNQKYEAYYRQLVKRENIKLIQKFNKDNAHHFTLRPNKFLSMTNEEFLQTYTFKNKYRDLEMQDIQQLTNSNSKGASLYRSLQPSISRITFQPVAQCQSINIDLTINASPVKNQGSCNSCYTHSAIATFQSLLHQEYGIKYDLSQQQLLQCTMDWAPKGKQIYNNNGCEGGWGWKSYHYLKFRGITLQQNYPYIAGKNKTTYNCNENSITGKRFKIKDYQYYYDNNWPQSQCNILQEKLIQGKTIAVSIFVPTGIQFQFYGSQSKGIDIFNKCGPYKTVNHQLQLVGATDKYWKLKNSFGTDWGEKGYLYLDKSQGLNCLNICMDFSFPTGINSSTIK